MKMTEHKRLSEELLKQGILWGSCAFQRGCHEHDELVEWILADRQAILDKVCEPLKKINIFIDEDNHSTWEVVKRGKAITNALNLAEEMKGVQNV